MAVKKKVRGISVLFERRTTDEDSMQGFIRYWAGNDRKAGLGHMEACYKRLLKAGLRPMAPGEARRVRIEIHDKP